MLNDARTPLFDVQALQKRVVILFHPKGVEKILILHNCLKLSKSEFSIDNKVPLNMYDAKKNSRT